MPLTLAQKLLLLGYPYPPPTPSSPWLAWKHTAVFLEDTVVCACDIPQRKAMRDAGSETVFDTALRAYLKDAGYLTVPIPDRKQAVAWLIGRAIQIKFCGDSERVNDMSSRRLSAIRWEGIEKGMDGLLEGVNDLLGKMQYPPVDDAVVGLATVLLLVKALQRRDPTVVRTETPQQLLQGLGMPYDVATPNLNLALRAVHVLFVSEMRVLQDTLNEAVAEMQNMTSDPRTDTGQARIGD